MHPGSKLTCEEAQTVINDFVYEGKSLRQIAEEYGLDVVAVRRLLRKETYKECVGEPTPEWLELIESISAENKRRGRPAGR